MRIVAAVVVGVVIAVLAAGAAALVGAYVYPPPPIVDINPALAREMMDRLPVGAFLWEIVGWAMGAFVGAAAAVRIARADAAWPAWAVAGGTGVAVLVASFVWPHPVWYPVLGLLAVGGAGYGAGRLFAPAAADHEAEPIETEAA